MPRRTTTNRTTPIERLTHQDRRPNIPTSELSGFLPDEDREPAPVLYPRDPSLDPQLVWVGKDAQDAEELAVPAVPIYIQEHVQPQAIVENVRAQARARRRGEQQLSLFDDFDGLDFEQTVEFYQWERPWANRMILGDSLQVMTSLAEKEGLRGKVQMIYFDPPYGIKFGSNWQVSTRKRDVRDGRAEDATRQPEQVKAFRDTWELGIHSYLSYLRDRLVVARDLLTESGSVFVQIGEENVHLVRCVMDEVFGAENFISQVAFLKTSGKASSFLDSVYDTLLWYSRSRDVLKCRPLYYAKSLGGEGTTQYVWSSSLDGEESRLLPHDELHDAQLEASARIFAADNLTSQSASTTTLLPFDYESSTYHPGKGGWKSNQQGLARLARAGRLMPIGKSLMYKRYLDDFAVYPINNIWRDTLMTGFSEAKLYIVQTSLKVIQRCLLMTTDPGDLVLDPTCGSGTTAYVAEQWGRRWITVDTSRVAVALARTRLMSAVYPYYLLADSPEGLVKEAEELGIVPPTPLPPTGADVKKGFVYRRVPHITLRDIANNEEIDAIHAHWQETLEPLRATLNRLLEERWEEWELPREPGEGWPAEAAEALAAWWQARRQRQAEIDASIARRSGRETLYDQPYADGKRIRVAGPFTVESLSPHRALAPGVHLPRSEAEPRRGEGPNQFALMVIDNLRAAGVQNTVKQERIAFDRLAPYPGRWLQAAGEYTDAAGQARRVAVHIGPEHGTVGPDDVREAAKEAMQGAGFDVLVVCAFAFDAHVSEQTRQFGRLVILPARMNPDLSMGDTLLKKTGAGNLFMVFGEPDIDVSKKGDRYVVRLKGVDVYDPTTGQIRSSSTDDIACWFIDTAYNQESFYVRHAYFTGAGEPYERLKRALRAEVDEAAWATLYTTTSYPFEPPSTGMIAVKVINHYGDEVMKEIKVW